MNKIAVAWVTVWETAVPPNFICLCPKMDWILMKLDGSVGTSIRLIVLKFHKNRFSDYVISDFFYSFFFLQRDIILWQREI